MRAWAVSDPEHDGPGTIQHTGKLDLHDAAPSLARLDATLAVLGALAKARIRLWRYDGRTLRLAAGDDPGWQPPVPHEGGRIPVMEHGWIWLQSIPDSIGFWLEVDPEDDRPVETLAPKLAEVVGSLLAGQSDLARVTEELAGRYEEIDLLYTISEILGRTVRLKEAANTILREVSTVVGARRASIMVYDEGTGMLRIVAARGVRPEQLSPVRKDDAESVAARVFREERLLAVNAEDPVPDKAFRAEEGSYLGRAYMSVPISYAAPGSAPRCVGVMNFTDRLGGDAFSTSDRKLVSAVANQVGAAVENARLAIRDLKRQRIQQELELAHDLQLKLMPAPSVLGDYADLAVRCIPADQVGGDFYTFQRRGEGKVGVMLGDVSSHGFSAALVMHPAPRAVGVHDAVFERVGAPLRHGAIHAFAHPGGVVGMDQAGEASLPVAHEVGRRIAGDVAHAVIDEAHPPPGADVAPIDDRRQIGDKAAQCARIAHSAIETHRRTPSDCMADPQTALIMRENR